MLVGKSNPSAIFSTVRLSSLMLGPEGDIGALEYAPKTMPSKEIGKNDEEIEQTQMKRKTTDETDDLLLFCICINQILRTSINKVSYAFRII